MESKCFSCKNKNVKTSYGYTTCNYSGSECRNFELYDPVKKTNADRIRAMNDEELASLLMYFADDTDGIDEKDYDAFGNMEWRERMLRWLKQEATE